MPVTEATISSLETSSLETSSVEVNSSEINASAAAVGQDSPKLPLTRMERIVLHLSLQGLSSREVAQRLFLSKRTVDFHRLNLYEKLGVHSLLEAASVCAVITVKPRYAPPPDWDRRLVFQRQPAWSSTDQTSQDKSPYDQALKPLKPLRCDTLEGCDTLEDCTQRRKAGTPCCETCRASVSASFTTIQGAKEHQ